MLFEFFNGSGPHWRYGLRGVCPGIESGHYYTSDAFDLPGGGFDNALFHAHASRSDVSYLCPYVDFLTEECRRKEVDVHVCDNEVEIVHVYLVSDYGGEVVDFRQIHEHEVDIVVEVSEHVDVGETNLHWNAVAEGESSVDDTGVVGVQERWLNGFHQWNCI